MSGIIAITYYGSADDPKIGDRIRLNLSGGPSAVPAPQQQYTAQSGSTVFSFNHGDDGRVIRLLLPASPMIEVEMDAAPGIYLEVWPQYFEKLIGATAMKSSPNSVGTLTHSGKWSHTGLIGDAAPSAKSNAVCICSMQVLMSAGCRCGATTPYAPPKTW